MNIAFVLPSGLTLGGVTTWSVEMGQRLAQMGKSIALIEHVSYGPRLNTDLPPKVQVVSCAGRMHPNSPALRVTDLADYLPAYHSQLPCIFVPNWSFGAYAACASIAETEPETLRVIGFAHTDEAEYYKWLTYYEPLIHRFVAVSQEIGVALADLLPHRAPDIVTRSYAVHVPDSLNREYSSLGEPLQLVYAGNLVERQKRISDLIRLVTALARESTNFQLRIIGDGRDREPLRRKIEALDRTIRARVKLEGSLNPEQMPKIWQSADICVLVSDYEGTSISMLEAMAHGCVPLVTSVSGTKAVIRQGVNGFSVPVGDMIKMARIIKQLDIDRARLARLGAAAHTDVQNHFSYPEYLRWFLATVDDVWAQPPRTWPAGRPLLPPELGKIEFADIWGLVRGSQSAAKTLLIKLARKPGMGWLYRR